MRLITLPTAVEHAHFGGGVREPLEERVCVPLCRLGVESLLLRLGHGAQR